MNLSKIIFFLMFFLSSFATIYLLLSCNFRVHSQIEDPGGRCLASLTVGSDTLILPIYILVGNKSDLSENTAFPVADYCRTNDIKYYIETSTMTGKGMNELSDIISEDIAINRNKMSNDGETTIIGPPKSNCTC